jgi:tripartite-type tricarboxylate transporter receptor subunit TctC
MKIRRRRFLHLAVSAAVMPAAPLHAWAQAYPTRPVRIIAGSAPGTSPDVAARLIAQWLSQRLGQPFVIENRDGAAGSLAAQVVMRAQPDGHTLLLFSASAVINPGIYNKLNISLQRDIAPVGSLVSLPNIIAVRSSFPAKTLADLIAAAKQHPGQINLGTPFAGSPQFVAGELLNRMAGVDIALIPYRGGPPAVTDALGGQVQGVIGTVLLLIDHVRSGSLRALAVTGAKRSGLLPNIPAVGESISGFEASQWIGLGAPKGTPPEVVEKLNREIDAGLSEPSLRSRIDNLGGTPEPRSVSAFGKFIADETAKWAEVIKDAGVKAH